MNKKEERRQKSHEAIMASATALLRERGIKASSVIDVMKGAGLTVGGFYRHFESKEHLFEHAIRTGATWTKLLESARGESVRERAMSIVRLYVSRAHRDTPEEGCILPSAAPEAARAGEPYRSALESVVGDFARQFGEVLGKGPEHRERALGLITLMVGAMTLSRAVAGTPLSDDVLRAAKKLAEQALADKAYD
ncbi:MAG: TetR/AcrR family transcriptional regulator [Polyangiaceae bacterium]|nr:TetR/AcrR family transcriptional regulator [Polyangiaceae bacterium]